MQELTAREIKCDEQGKVSYEVDWTIPNWREVRQDVNHVRNQRAIFETGIDIQPPQMVQTKWLVGLQDVRYEYGRRAKVYWQLLDVKGSVSQLKLDAKISTTLCIAPGAIASAIKDERNKIVSMFQIIEEKSEHLDMVISADGIDADYIDSNGAVNYKLGLTFKIPVFYSAYFEKIQMERFSKQSHDQLRENLAVLLRDNFKGDLKIITSDGVELLGHQNILEAQCPVFAGMLNCNSDFSESKTGIVKVDDISGKTMKIVMRYFYTGDLLEGWRDDDTIVEFVYAAGKYQMTKVLELLNSLLGRSDQDEVSSLDVQLLNLAGKLSLKNAENRLLQRVVGQIRGISKSEEFFQLFGYDSEEISSKAEEQSGNGKSFLLESEILEKALGNSDEPVFSHPRRGLILLALVQRNGLKTLEQLLLKRFIEIAGKITTGEDLFKFFGDCK